jgi:hypothetical protein
MNVAVVTPRRSDGGRRDELWAWVKDRWHCEHPDFYVFEGHHDDGPFNRSAAINAAVAQDHDADVYIIADSDSFVSVEQINQAIHQALEHFQVTFAYDRFCYLNRQMTAQVMDGFDGNWWPGVEWTMTGTCSSMVVVPGDLWREMGGADEGFVGWGGEDIGLSLALQALGGGMRRIPGEVWHLFHTPAAHTHDHVWPDRIKRYEACNYQREPMLALLAELRAEVVSPRSCATVPKDAESGSLPDHQPGSHS